jgi:hypothetical protein
MAALEGLEQRQILPEGSRQTQADLRTREDNTHT